MKNRSIISSNGAGARINVTPMIDVVMVLIVFYLLVGQLALDRKASIRIPGSTSGLEEQQTLDPIIVGITSEGIVSINGVTLDQSLFIPEIENMHARSPGTPIRLRADRDAPFGVIRPIMHAMRDANIPRVELVTEQRR